MKVKFIKFRDTIRLPDKMRRPREDREFNMEGDDAKHFEIILDKSIVNIFLAKDGKLLAQVPFENVIYWVPEKTKEPVIEKPKPKITKKVKIVKPKAMENVIETIRSEAKIPKMKADESNDSDRG